MCGRLRPSRARWHKRRSLRARLLTSDCHGDPQHGAYMNVVATAIFFSRHVGLSSCFFCCHFRLRGNDESIQSARLRHGPSPFQPAQMQKATDASRHTQQRRARSSQPAPPTPIARQVPTATAKSASRYRAGASTNSAIASAPSKAGVRLAWRDSKISSGAKKKNGQQPGNHEPWPMIARAHTRDFMRQVFRPDDRGTA